MLARLLIKGGVHVTVFEAEESPNYRSQGGSLDLHTDTGLKALKKADLFDQFLQHARYDGQYMMMSDKKLESTFTMGESTILQKVEERPEIDRAALRQILTESLPAGTIRWGHKLKCISETDAGKTLVFHNGHEDSSFDYIVGADGAWSKVRAFIAPDLKLVPSGLAYLSFSIPDAATTAPATYALVNRGSFFCYGDRMAQTHQQQGNGSINISFIWHEANPDWHRRDVCGADSCDGDAMRAFALRKTEGWHDKIRAALYSSQGACQPRTLFELPIGVRWEHRRGVTMVGDAAHLMTPFAGEGVNVGLEDAMALAEGILAAVGATKDGSQVTEAVDAAVAECEKVMFPRVQRYMQLTDNMKRATLFTDEPLDTIIYNVISIIAKDNVPAVLHPLVTLGVSGFFLGRKLVNWGYWALGKGSRVQ